LRLPSKLLSASGAVLLVMGVGAGFGIKQGHFAFLRGSVGGINAAIAICAALVARKRTG